MIDNAPGLAFPDERFKLRETGFGNLFQAAEISKQPGSELVADTWNRSQLRCEIAHCAPLSVICDRKSVGLVPNHLNQVQHRRVMVDSDRFFAALQKQQLFTFSDRCGRQGFQPYLVERPGGRLKLPFAAVDQHEIGQRLTLAKQPRVLSSYDSIHRSKVIGSTLD